ncbi:MAG: hypothetical protein KDD36_05905 [Flavobacteriales bacterium]|nr:hypothetical protein [Flavobacteriales bacterium]
MRLFRYGSLLGALLLVTVSLRAQDVITMDQTIAFIQSKMNDHCRLDMKNGGKLVITYFRDGVDYREDILFTADMDTAQISYNPDEQSINIHCMEGEDECVTRRLYKDKERRFYSRVNFAFGFSPEEAQVLMDAFKHMIILVKDDKYERTKPFE